MNLKVFYNILMLCTLILLTACEEVDLPKEKATFNEGSADSSHLLAGYVAFDSSGEPIIGNMTNIGVLDLSQTFSGPGYVSSISGLSASDVCSTSSFLGAPGTGVCLTSTLSTPATASDVLTGKQFFDNSGTVQNGTMTNHGALNLDTTAIPGTPAGYYSSITSTITASDLCSGKSIFGSAGTAVCNSVYADIVVSGMHRDPATAQMTLTTETSTSSYAAGYREVPDINKDIWGNSNNTTTTFATRPTVACGATQTTIDLRIDDCLSNNPTSATWDGVALGVSTEGTWKLVTYTGGFEVWRDERTKLLWSDNLGSDNWCRAAGNVQADDPSGYCNNGTYQNQTTPTSYCAEAAGLSSALGENWTTGSGSYSDGKGGMGKLSSPTVRWRLPTFADWNMAILNGLNYVLPNLDGFDHWTATITSSNHGGLESAWVTQPTGTYSGTYLYSYNRTSGIYIRCVGR